MTTMTKTMTTRETLGPEGIRAVRVGARTRVAGRTHAHARRRRCRLDHSRDNPTTITTSRSNHQRHRRLHRPCLRSPRSAAKRANRPAHPHQRRRHPRDARIRRLPRRSRPASRRLWRPSSRTLPPHHHALHSSLKDSRTILVCILLGSSASRLDSRALASAAPEMESGTWVPFWRTGVMPSVAVSKGLFSVVCLWDPSIYFLVGCTLHPLSILRLIIVTTASVHYHNRLVREKYCLCPIHLNT